MTITTATYNLKEHGETATTAYLVYLLSGAVTDAQWLFAVSKVDTNLPASDANGYGLRNAGKVDVLDRFLFLAADCDLTQWTGAVVIDTNGYGIIYKVGYHVGTGTGTPSDTSGVDISKVVLQRKIVIESKGFDNEGRFNARMQCDGVNVGRVPLNRDGLASKNMYHINLVPAGTATDDLFTIIGDQDNCAYLNGPNATARDKMPCGYNATISGVVSDRSMLFGSGDAGYDAGRLLVQRSTFLTTQIDIQGGEAGTFVNCSMPNLTLLDLYLTEGSLESNFVFVAGKDWADEGWFGATKTTLNYTRGGPGGTSKTFYGGKILKVALLGSDGTVITDAKVRSYDSRDTKNPQPNALVFDTSKADAADRKFPSTLYAEPDSSGQVTYAAVAATFLANASKTANSSEVIARLTSQHTIIRAHGYSVDATDESNLGGTSADSLSAYSPKIINQLAYVTRTAAVISAAAADTLTAVAEKVHVLAVALSTRGNPQNENLIKVSGASLVATSHLVLSATASDGYDASTDTITINCDTSVASDSTFTKLKTSKTLTLSGVTLAAFSEHVDSNGNTIDGYHLELTATANLIAAALEWSFIVYGTLADGTLDDITEHDDITGSLDIYYPVQRGLHTAYSVRVFGASVHKSSTPYTTLPTTVSLTIQTEGEYLSHAAWKVEFESGLHAVALVDSSGDLTGKIDFTSTASGGVWPAASGPQHRFAIRLAIEAYNTDHDTHIDEDDYFRVSGALFQLKKEIADETTFGTINDTTYDTLEVKEVNKAMITAGIGITVQTATLKGAVIRSLLAGDILYTSEALAGTYTIAATAKTIAAADLDSDGNLLLEYNRTSVSGKVIYCRVMRRGFNSALATLTDATADITITQVAIQGVTVGTSAIQDPLAFSKDSSGTHTIYMSKNVMLATNTAAQNRQFMIDNLAYFAQRAPAFFGINAGNVIDKYDKGYINLGTGYDLVGPSTTSTTTDSSGLRIEPIVSISGSAFKINTTEGGLDSSIGPIDGSGEAWHTFFDDFYKTGYSQGDFAIVIAPNAADLASHTNIIDTVMFSLIYQNLLLGDTAYVCSIGYVGDPRSLPPAQGGTNIDGYRIGFPTYFGPGTKTITNPSPVYPGAQLRKVDEGQIKGISEASVAFLGQSTIEVNVDLESVKLNQPDFDALMLDVPPSTKVGYHLDGSAIASAIAGVQTSVDALPAGYTLEDRTKAFNLGAAISSVATAVAGVQAAINAMPAGYTADDRSAATARDAAVGVLATTLEGVRTAIDRRPIDPRLIAAFEGADQTPITIAAAASATLADGSAAVAISMSADLRGSGVPRDLIGFATSTNGTIYVVDNYVPPLGSPFAITSGTVYASGSIALMGYNASLHPYQYGSIDSSAWSFLGEVRIIQQLIIDNQSASDATTVQIEISAASSSSTEAIPVRLVFDDGTVLNADLEHSHFANGIATYKATLARHTFSSAADFTATLTDASRLLLPAAQGELGTVAAGTFPVGAPVFLRVASGGYSADDRTTAASRDTALTDLATAMQALQDAIAAVPPSYSAADRIAATARDTALTDLATAMLALRATAERLPIDPRLIPSLDGADLTPIAIAAVNAATLIDSSAAIEVVLTHPLRPAAVARDLLGMATSINGSIYTVDSYTEDPTGTANLLLPAAQGELGTIDTSTFAIGEPIYLRIASASKDSGGSNAPITGGYTETDRLNASGRLAKIEDVEGKLSDNVNATDENRTEIETLTSKIQTLTSSINTVVAAVTAASTAASSAADAAAAASSATQSTQQTLTDLTPAIEATAAVVNAIDAHTQRPKSTP